MNSVQVPGLAATAMAARAALRAAQAARRLAQLHGIDQRVEATLEELVNRRHDLAEFGAVKMPLHQGNQVLHQQVALNLHDGRGGRADKVDHEVIASLALFVAALFVVKVLIVKSHLDGRAGFGQIVQAHAHFV